MKEDLEIGGKSGRVGLSTEYGRTKGGCGDSSKVVARYVPEENLVAKGDAVAGRGFLRTGDDEVEEIDDMVSVLDRKEDEDISRLIFEPCSAVPGPVDCG